MISACCPKLDLFYFPFQRITVIRTVYIRTDSAEIVIRLGRGVPSPRRTHSQRRTIQTAHPSFSSPHTEREPAAHHRPRHTPPLLIPLFAALSSPSSSLSPPLTKDYAVTLLRHKQRLPHHRQRQPRHFSRSHRLAALLPQPLRPRCPAYTPPPCVTPAHPPAVARQRIISIIGTDTQCAALVLGCRCDHDWSSTAQAAPKGPACAAGTTTAAAWCAA